MPAERDYVDNLCVGFRMLAVLKLVLNQQDWLVKTARIWLRIRIRQHSCKAYFGFVQYTEYLDIVSVVTIVVVIIITPTTTITTSTFSRS